MDCIDVLEMEVNINKLIEMKVVIIKEQRGGEYMFDRRGYSNNVCEWSDVIVGFSVDRSGYGQ